jgi:hypothetical protein
MPATALAEQPLPVEHWGPQPGPQEALLSCPIEDIGFGGARGGGKTAGMLGDFLSHEAEYGKFARGIFFRRTYGELEEVIRQADALFLPLGWTRKGGDRVTYTAPSGAVLKCRAIQVDSDANKYQGHSYTWIGFDEATNWSSPDPLDKLRACLRSSDAPNIRKRMIFSANPGGVGHNWYKARYVDPSAPYAPFYDEELLTWRVFIPSTLDNNPALMLADPEYWKRVVASANGRQDLIKAWRFGEWDLVAGGMFDDVYRVKTHVLAPFSIPKSWRIDRSFDWGSSKPFSVGWWAESDGTTAPNGRTYPKGTLFRIAEWYGWNGKPNQGLKMLAVDIAKRIVEIEKMMLANAFIQTLVKPGPADSSIFDVENGMCLEKDMRLHGVSWVRADKSPGSRITGWEKLRARFMACRKFPMEDPGIFVFNTCRNWIRCVPLLPRDAANPDDVDTNAEDHNGDETRYKLLQKIVTVSEEKLSGFS